VNPKTEETAGESAWHKNRKRAGRPGAEPLAMAFRGKHDKVMAMLAEARVPSNSRILDIGAGLGSLSRLLK
jgi:tRNA1(Val) A37 N6-methylase TrmN6